MCYIFFIKSCDEDIRFGKNLREEPVGARLCFPAESGTTSEPVAGNGSPGAPVIASMSGLVRKATRVEPWNTNVYVSHP